MRSKIMGESSVSEWVKRAVIVQSGTLIRYSLIARMRRPRAAASEFRESNSRACALNDRSNRRREVTHGIVARCRISPLLAVKPEPVASRLLPAHDDGDGGPDEDLTINSQAGF